MIRKDLTIRCSGIYFVRHKSYEGDINIYFYNKLAIVLANKASRQKVNLYIIIHEVKREGGGAWS